MAPTMGYTHARGLAQYIRNLLVYKGIPFEDKQYKTGPAPDFDRSDWTNVKFTLGLKFPNLPYFIDGDVKMTQSVAIIRHLGRKYDLAARTEEEAMELDQLEQQAKDLLWGLAMTAMNPAFETARARYEKNLGNLLKPWAEHLRERRWVMGDRLTYVDFIVHEALDWNRAFKPEAFEEYPELVEYLQRFRALPNMEEYLTSEAYRAMPLLGPMAKWGGKPF
ncbi:glutathione S-transferase [Ixodes scapularis]